MNSAGGVARANSRKWVASMRVNFMKFHHYLTFALLSLILLRVLYTSPFLPQPSHKAIRAKPTFPPQCKLSEYDIIRFHLPEKNSISIATRCPDPYWFQDQYKATTTVTPQHGNTRPVAIMVGCNKGTDAVDTLSMISGLKKYDVNSWYTLFAGSESVSPSSCSKKGHRDKVSSDAVSPDAIVHCIEAMPKTGARLLKTTTELGWEENLIVTNIAIADQDGVALFPNVEDEYGVESLGLSHCQMNEYKHLCREVPVARMDTFSARYLEPDSNFDFLSIDAEGHDFEVLLGATETLRRTKYLEFEYHSVGAWPKHLLSTAITMLKELNFVCYWAGSHGHIWRITDCWLDSYEHHGWSNVACVNVGISGTEILASRMESDFQKTLGLNRTIQYAIDGKSPFIDSA